MRKHPMPPRASRAPLSLALASLSALAALAACGVGSDRPPSHIAPAPLPAPSAEREARADPAPKEEPRLLPPEAYLRTYLEIFGAEGPLDAQKRAREGGLFDSWDDYFAALGFPDYRIDLPRATQTNALMMATFERLGVALCDRAVERDLKGKSPPPVSERKLFAFDLPKELDEAGFAPRFEVLHRAFLGYPVELAPPDRRARFYGLYRAVTARHGQKGAPKSRFSPAEAGWAAVCYGLVRHPELHLY